MDFRHLEYIVEIAKENSITQAAKNLFVSQSAVNQQLLKLEKELGTHLFIRSRGGWRLSEAGKIYLDGAKEALLIKKNVYNQINDLTKSHKGTLRVGLLSGRDLIMFTTIYPELRAKYSDVTVMPLEMDVVSQERAVAEGSIDMGFVALLKEQRAQNNYIEVGVEEMVVMLPTSHPLCQDVPTPQKKRLPAIDLDLLKEDPFILLYKKSTIRKICDRIFERAGWDPRILMETSRPSHVARIVETVGCCGIAPRYYAEPDNERLRCFVLPHHPSWDLCLSYRRRSYLTDASNEYIKLVKKYWRDHLVPPQKN